MPADNEREKSFVASEIQEQTTQTAQGMLMKSLSRIPFGVGSDINDMLTQLAPRYAHADRYLLIRKTNDVTAAAADIVTTSSRCPQLGAKLWVPYL